MTVSSQKNIMEVFDFRNAVNANIAMSQENLFYREFRVTFVKTLWILKTHKVGRLKFQIYTCGRDLVGINRKFMAPVMFGCPGTKYHIKIELFGVKNKPTASAYGKVTLTAEQVLQGGIFSLKSRGRILAQVDISFEKRCILYCKSSKRAMGIEYV